MEQTSFRDIFKGAGSQIVASLIVTISTISDGMQYGWTAPYLPILRSEESPIKISKSDESWLESTYLIAGFLALPVIIYSVDKIGRYKCIVVGSFLCLITWIIIAFTNSVVVLYVARFIAGSAGDIAFLATPMYIAEIADKKIRGFLSSLIYTMLLLGIFLIYAIAPYVPFYAPSLLASILLLIQLISFTFIPESPYFLISKNKYCEARYSLKKLRPLEHDTEKEMEEIKSGVERMKRESGGIRDLFMDSGNRRAFLIVSTLVGGQHFCGISVMLMNLHSILLEAGSIYLDSNITGIVFSLVMLIAAGVSSLFVDKYGRKILLISSCCLTGINLLILAVYFNLKNSGYDVHSVSWIPLVCVITYGLVFKFGLGLMPIILSAELFSNNVKAIGMSFADLMYVLFGFLSIEFYQISSSAFGIHTTFYTFAVAAFASAIFCIYCVPETKGKTLDEIQVLLRND